MNDGHPSQVKRQVRSSDIRHQHQHLSRPSTRRLDPASLRHLCSFQDVQVDSGARWIVGIGQVHLLSVLPASEVIWYNAAKDPNRFHSVALRIDDCLRLRVFGH